MINYIYIFIEECSFNRMPDFGKQMILLEAPSISVLSRNSIVTCDRWVMFIGIPNNFKCIINTNISKFIVHLSLKYILLTNIIQHWNHTDTKLCYESEPLCFNDSYACACCIPYPRLYQLMNYRACECK